MNAGTWCESVSLVSLCSAERRTLNTIRQWKPRWLGHVFRNEVLLWEITKETRSAKHFVEKRDYTYHKSWTEAPSLYLRPSLYSRPDWY